MLNSLFSFIKQYPLIQSTLAQRFNLKIALKAFSETKVPYWIFELNLDKAKTIQINNISFQVDSHHFTIPKNVDDKTNSVYHYTLILKNTQKQTIHKVHLYFDKLDRLNVEPKLYPYQDEKITLNSAFSDLSKTDVENILDYSLNAAQVISFLRQQQKMNLNIHLISKDNIERELMFLSLDFIANKNKYIETAKKQIDTLSIIETLGNNFFVGERIFYEGMIKELSKSNSFDSPVEFSPESSQEEAIFEQLPKKISNKSKTNHNAPSIDYLQLEYNQLIIRGENLIAEFNITEKSKLTPELIINMINTAHACKVLLLSLKDNKSKENCLKTKSALIALIIDVFNEKNSSLDEYLDAYLIALKAQLFLMSDNFIKCLVLSDNIEILKKAMQHNLIIESARYRFEQGGPNFTIVEWCIYHSSLKCFNELLNQDFSLNYSDKANSSFCMIGTNSEKEEILSYSNMIKINSSGKERLFNRIIFLLTANWNVASENEKELLALRIAIMQTHKKIMLFLDKRHNGVYKNMLLSNESRFKRVALKKSHVDKVMKLNRIKADIELNKAMLSFHESFYELLKVLKPNLKNILYCEGLAETEQHNAEFYSAQDNRCINALIQYFKNATRQQQLEKDIIVFGNPSSYEIKKGFGFSKKIDKITEQKLAELKKTRAQNLAKLPKEVEPKQNKVVTIDEFDTCQASKSVNQMMCGLSNQQPLLLRDFKVKDDVKSEKEDKKLNSKMKRLNLT